MDPSSEGSVPSEGSELTVKSEASVGSEPSNGFTNIDDEEIVSDATEEELTEEYDDDSCDAMEEVSGGDEEDGCMYSSMDDPEGTYEPSSPIDSAEETNLDTLETTQDIGECSDPTFQSHHRPSPTGSMSSSFGLPSPSHDFLEEDENPDEWLAAQNSTAVGSSHTHEHLCRKRPHSDDVHDVKPGQWVAITIMEGLVVPGMFVRQIGDCSEVALLAARKSGWDWDRVVMLDSMKVSSILDTPKVCAQIGSKSQPATEETHTPKCCTKLLTLDIKGWNLNFPVDNEDVRPRNRSELLRLLNEITTGLKFFDDRKYDDRNLKYFRRLASKLRYNLSPYKSNVYQPACSCQVLSESCSGLVRGPPTLMEIISCEYTERVLPPVIFQTFEMKPQWLKIHKEIIRKVREKNESAIGCIRVFKRPLTFAHITSQHVPAIQCLLGTYFWSNVDVSTVLQYPEFTCVVLYGKLVVGFGYLSPGAHRNEGYINFLFVRPHWRRCGIGETILYLLRQQCLFWTLTLHVSPNSEALNLYHKFGFKIYSRIKNFYAGYVISNSQSEKDALFMKLESRIPQMF